MKNNIVYELYTYNNGEKITIGYSENMTDEKELEIKYKQTFNELRSIPRLRMINI